MVVSCQRHKIDPFQYLRDTLARLPNMTNQDDLAALSPSQWSPIEQPIGNHR
ncbi:MAG: transposase domain-containing protein [Opitutales bacterium]